MNKYSLLIILFCLLNLGWARAQSLYVASDSEVSFFSETPVENIQAQNSAATAAINVATKEVAVKVPIKQFKFKNSLMQEHFNENYMESDKYPTALFRGKINENVDLTKEGTYQVSATGKLNMHGMERDKTIKGVLKVLQDKMMLFADFDVLLVDYNIERPSIVFTKIAEKIDVKTKFALAPKK